MEAPAAWLVEGSLTRGGRVEEEPAHAGAANADTRRRCACNFPELWYIRLASAANPVSYMSIMRLHHHNTHGNYADDEFRILVKTKDRP